MKVASGQSEEGILIGNTYDKYNSKNPIARWMLGNFRKCMIDFTESAAPQSIYEAGCGEGYWMIYWKKRYGDSFSVRGSDFSDKVIAMAKENAKQENVDPEIFSVCSIYDIRPEMVNADLLLCCEVLEHLEDPEAALRNLAAAKCKHYIFSVPNEPVWSFLNMVRGKYWKSLGNTPGHIQKWNKTSFRNMLQKYYIVEKVATPLPWTMCLCRPKDS